MFVKLSCFSVLVQAFAGTLFTALLLGSFHGDALLLLTRRPSPLAEMFGMHFMTSLIPCLAVAGVLASVAGKASKVRASHWIVGTGLGSGAISAVVAAGYGRLLLTDSPLLRAVSAEVFAALLSGGVTGLYAVRLRQRDLTKRESQQ